jgi:Subtilase family
MPPTVKGLTGVPCRFRHSVLALLTVGLAAAWLLGSMPAQASQARPQEWWLGKLGVRRAWQTSDGSGVIVAVLSDGVAASQPDLRGSVIAGPDFTKSGQPDKGPYFGVQGTQAASLIAGRWAGSGVVGIAPAAKILSVRVTLSSGDPLLSDPAIVAGLPAAIGRGIRYAVRHGATVIDLPLDPLLAGAPSARLRWTEVQAAAHAEAAEEAAVDFAQRKGVVLVAPAGDDGAGTDAPNYPAADPGVIAVGAFDRDIIMAPFSSRQRYVLLTAPGSGVVAADASGGYGTVNSTSAASAIVAGIAALIRSRFPDLSPRQITRVLTSSTVFGRDGGKVPGAGFGTVDAARAVARAAAIHELARQAGAGARPWVRPAPPPVAAASTSLAPRLLKDGLVVAAVLIVVLVLITVYGLMRLLRRRRARMPVAAASAPARHAVPERHAQGRGRQPGRVANAFAVQPAATAGPRPPVGARILPGTGRPSGAALAGGPGGSGPEHGAGPAGTDAPPGPEATTEGLGPAAGRAPSRTARAAKASGSPPWEPAPRPAGERELPWAATLAPSPTGRRPPAVAALAAPVAAADLPWAGELSQTPPASPAWQAGPAYRPGPAWDAGPPGPTGPPWPPARLPDQESPAEPG